MIYLFRSNKLSSLLTKAQSRNVLYISKNILCHFFLFEPFFYFKTSFSYTVNVSFVFQNVAFAEISKHVLFGFSFFFTCGDIVMRRLFTLEFWRRRVFLFVKRPGNHRSLGKFWFSWNLYRWNNFAKLFRYCWRQMRLLNLGSLFNFWFI